MARLKIESLKIPCGLRQFKRFIFKNKQSLEGITLQLLSHHQGHGLDESHRLNLRLLYILSESSDQSGLLGVIERENATRAEMLQYLIQKVFNNQLIDIQQVEIRQRQCFQVLRNVKRCHEQVFHAWPSMKRDEIHIEKEELIDFVAQHLYLPVWVCISQRRSSTLHPDESVVKDLALLDALACLAQSIKRYPHNCQFFLHSAVHTLREPDLAYERKCAVLKECGVCIIHYNQPGFSFFSTESSKPTRTSFEETKEEVKQALAYGCG